MFVEEILNLFKVQNTYSYGDDGNFIPEIEYLLNQDEEDIEMLKYFFYESKNVNLIIDYTFNNYDCIPFCMFLMSYIKLLDKKQHENLILRMHLFFTRDENNFDLKFITDEYLKLDNKQKAEFYKLAEMYNFYKEYELDIYSPDDYMIYEIKFAE